MLSEERVQLGYSRSLGGGQEKKTKKDNWREIEDEEKIKVESFLEKVGVKYRAESQLKSRAKKGIDFGSGEVTSDTYHNSVNGAKGWSLHAEGSKQLVFLYVLISKHV